MTDSADLKADTPSLLTIFSSSWFQSIAVRTKNECLNCSVLHVGITTDLLLFLADVFTMLVVTLRSNVLELILRYLGLILRYA